jgi:hypothetical protein
VDPRAGPDDVEKRTFLTPQGLELRPLGHPARSQSLHRLRYPKANLVNFQKLLQKKNHRLHWDFKYIVLFPSVVCKMSINPIVQSESRL